MGKLWEEFRAEAFAEGYAEGYSESYAEGYTEGICSSLIAIMNNLNISFEEAMRILSISQEDYPKYQSLMKE